MQINRTAVLVAGAAIALSAGGAHAEEVYKAQSAMATNLLYTQAFRTLFLEDANKRAKGIVRIHYTGGPEVTPARNAAQALGRGVFDILYSPTGYYEGVVPEGMALNVAGKGPAEARANGGYELLNRFWAERINARILSWGLSETRFNLYLSIKPPVTKDGMITLEGYKLRTSPTYRPLFTGIGATTVSMKASELHTALERGVVVGTGWPNVGLSNLGVGRLLKYRVDPPFFRLNHLVIVNLDKWKALSQKGKDALDAAGIEFEKSSVGFIARHAKEDAARLAEQGIKPFELTGTAARKYLSIANEGMWARLKDRSPHYQALRAKFE